MSRALPKGQRGRPPTVYQLPGYQRCVSRTNGLRWPLRFWWRCRQLGPIGDDPGRPLFTIQRNAHGAYDIYAHDTEDVLSAQMRNTASAGEQRMVRQLQLGRERDTRLE